MIQLAAKQQPANRNRRNSLNNNVPKKLAKMDRAPRCSGNQNTEDSAASFPLPIVETKLITKPPPRNSEGEVERTWPGVNVPGNAQFIGPNPAATTLKPSLSLSNNSYADSGNTSHKRIKFNVTVPIPLDPQKVALVNHLQGHMKKSNGTYWKVRMYGNLVDFNFSSMQVDSVDADPVYWSNSTSRWNYTSTSSGFYGTDDPGPPGHIFNPGDEAKVKFKIGVYWLDDVQTTTTGSITASPIQTLPWQYSVKADSTSGALSHPTI